MKHQLDWSSYETAGQGDAYAGIPTHGGDFAKAVAVCISDRLCQRKPKGVMCPSFRATDDPGHSPGGRVLLLKAALNGELGEAPFADPRLAAAMELCVGCKGCKRECANQVDMAAIKIEYQAQRNLALGTPRRDRLFAALPRLLAHRGVVRQLVRLRNRLPFLARLGERWLGISAQRVLPEPSPEAYRPPATAGSGEREVILFVDTFARHFDPAIAHAAHAVLSAAGYRVTSLEPLSDATEPTRPLCCGRTYLSLGQVDAARAEARRMHAALRPALEAGVPIVGLEPSCILSLRDDHLKLGLGADAEKLAKQVYLFEEFIAREHDRKNLQLTLKPLPDGKTLVHGHCHQKAVGAMKSLRKVLRLIPDFEFEFIEASCCGMAGSFGLDAEHRDISLQMAELDLLPALRNAPEATVLANGFSCRHQIREGAERQAQHVAVLLERALA
ncbi:(Fe-S)-binding protein [Zoogloea sp. LCSB751]|uniref:(Fe-S)-binding protein n=1 Tax=Zoogloea sp. LCSB751 TaxID=1965277 RepID=UPI0009A51870|nr:(Fe-S)-binding protein [Zoogloea sp. LCSB751]